MTGIDQLRTKLQQEPKKWLITGVAGFIGSNILEELLELKQVVVGLDNFSTGYRRNLDDVRRLVGRENWSRFEFHEGDIRNLDDCRLACSGVHYVLHQAALGSVPRSIDNPVLTNQSNVDGFLNMLVTAREARVDRFIFASSSSIYGDSQRLPKVEDCTGAPLSPYAASKAMNEIYAGVFSRVYGVEWIALRYFNVFGKRQDPQGVYAAVIPRWIDALVRLQPPAINGDGQTSRDFCYIKDVVQANILAAMNRSSEALNRPYNIAYGSRTTLNELFLLIRKSLIPHIRDVEGITPVFGPFRQGDVRHSLADISMAGKLLGYVPAFGVEEGIAETIRWYFDSAGVRVSTCHS